jgi:WD40 repeat protein/beta-lactamase regulating signal transducer with metallopeptidase domain
MSAALPEAVLGNLFVAAVLALAATAAGRWGRRPAVTHVLWLLVLVKLVTPPVFRVPVRLLPAESESAAISIPVVDPTPAPPAMLPVEHRSKAAPTPAAQTALPTIIEPIRQAADGAESRRSQGAAVAVPWETVAVFAWLTGSLAWLGLAYVRTRRFARFLRFSHPAPAEFAREVAAVARRMGLRGPRVRIVPGRVSPLVWNLGRPTLFFPGALIDRLCPGKRAALVAHELAHLRRGDHLVRWLELFVVAAYWWCPLAWFARRELRRAEEECCDAWVTHVLPDAGPDYATALLDTIDFLADARPFPAMASAVGDAASLRVRLLAILAGRRPARLSRSVRATVFLLGIGLLPLGPTLARLAAAPRDVVEDWGVVEATAPVALAPRGEPVLFADEPDRLPGVGGPALAAAASTDGRFLAIAAGNAVAVTDRTTGRPAFTLTGHTDLVAAVAFAPDGKTIATGSYDGMARLWNAADGTEIAALPGHTSWVHAVAFSPSGAILATGGYDRAVRLWDVAEKKLLHTLTGPDAGVRCVTFSPDGSLVVAAGADKVIRSWNVSTGSPRKPLTGHTRAVRGLVFSPDGKTLASGSEDRSVRFWDLAAGRETGAHVSVPESVTAVRFSPGGRVLFAGTAAGRVLNLDPTARRLRGPLGATVSPEGGAVVRVTHADAVTAVLNSAGVAVSVAQDGSAFAWPTAAAPVAPALTFGHTAPVSSVAVSADGRTLAAGARDGSIRVWDSATGSTIKTLTGHLGAIVAVAFSPDGGKLVSAGDDETVRVWDVITGQVLKTLIQSKPLVRVALSPDGKTIAMACAGLPTVKVCSLKTGETTRTLVAPGPVTAVTFNPEGTVLATGTADGRLSVWDTGSWEERHREPVGDRPGRIDRIAFAKDGKTAALVLNADGADGEPDHAVVFWNPSDAAVRDDRPRLAHAGPIGDAAFTPDGGGVVTAGHDGRVYVWDVETGRPARQLRGHTDTVSAVAVSPDGSSNYSAGDSAVLKWMVDRPDRAAAPNTR